MWRFLLNAPEYLLRPINDTNCSARRVAHCFAGQGPRSIAVRCGDSIGNMSSQARFRGVRPRGEIRPRSVRFRSGRRPHSRVEKGSLQHPNRTEPNRVHFSRPRIEHETEARLIDRAGWGWGRSSRRGLTRVSWRTRGSRTGAHLRASDRRQGNMFWL